MLKYSSKRRNIVVNVKIYTCFYSSNLLFSSKREKIWDLNAGKGFRFSRKKMFKDFLRRSINLLI